MEPERNLRLTLAYDGTDFHGWQSQPGLRTVQGVVEEAAQRVLRHPLHASGAGRTDAGVHARGQVCNLRTASRISCEKIRLAVGHRLPTDVSLIDVSDAPEDFHASRSAVSKLYRYTIFNSRRRPVESLRQRYAAHIWHSLDLDRLRAAADGLVGTHDFAGFATAGSQRRTTVRTILAVDVTQRDAEVDIAFEGDGFLYNQVRNMVGTLIEIGRGHWPVARIAEVLTARDRRLAGTTAPPHGLCLEWVRY